MDNKKIYEMGTKGREKILNVLMISYFFPPHGCVGVQRILAYVKYLKKFGWTPSVLTVGKGSSYFLWDYSLLKEVPRDISIHRTKTLEIPKSIARIVYGGLRKLKLLNLFFIPDQFVGWLPFAYLKALKMIKKNDYDVIYTTSSPYTSHLVGYLLKKKTGKPWVADFRDEWAQNPFLDYTLIDKKINQWLERKILKNADKVISTSKVMTNELKTLIKGKKNKFHTITNGYNEGDFKDYPARETYGNEFRITYMGSFYGGYPSGLQYPHYFFEAIVQLLKEKKISEKEFRIVLIGKNKEIDPRVPKRMVSILGQVPHNKVLKYLAKSSIFLLYVSKKRGNACIPAKIFEYIRASRPILSLIPKKGAAANLIKETNTGIVLEPEGIEEIKTAIMDLYHKWKKRNMKIKPNWKRVIKYERQNLTEKLALIFDSLITQ
jgi:glycosyltransferase involved in cell wall biosynthesis